MYEVTVQRVSLPVGVDCETRCGQGLPERLAAVDPRRGDVRLAPEHVVADAFEREDATHRRSGNVGHGFCGDGYRHR